MSNVGRCVYWGLNIKISLCIDILDAKGYQCRNSNPAFDLSVFWHVFFFLSVCFSSLLSIFGGCSHPCTKTYYSFYNAMKCSSLVVFYVWEKYHSENHDNLDKGCSSESKKEYAKPIQIYICTYDCSHVLHSIYRVQNPTNLYIIWKIMVKGTSLPSTKKLAWNDKTYIWIDSNMYSTFYVVCLTHSKIWLKKKNICYELWSIPMCTVHIMLCAWHTRRRSRETYQLWGKWTRSSLPFQSLVKLTTNNIFTKMTIWHAAGNGNPGSLIHTWCTICIPTITTSSSYTAKTISIPRKQITETSKTDVTLKRCARNKNWGTKF